MQNISNIILNSLSALRQTVALIHELPIPELLQHCSAAGSRGLEALLLVRIVNGKHSALGQGVRKREPVVKLPFPISLEALTDELLILELLQCCGRSCRRTDHWYMTCWFYTVPVWVGSVDGPTQKKYPPTKKRWMIFFVWSTSGHWNAGGWSWFSCSQRWGFCLHHERKIRHSSLAGEGQLAHLTCFVPYIEMTMGAMYMDGPVGFMMRGFTGSGRTPDPRHINVLTLCTIAFVCFCSTADLALCSLIVQVWSLGVVGKRLQSLQKCIVFPHKGGSRLIRIGS